MHLSLHRPATSSIARTSGCKLCALPRWDEQSEIPRRGGLQQRGSRLRPDREARDLQGGPSSVRSLSPLDVPADLSQKCGRFRPTRPQRPSRDPVPSGRPERRVALLQAWHCSPVILEITPRASFVHPRSPLSGPYATSPSWLRTTYLVGFPPSSSSVRLPAYGLHRNSHPT